MHCHLISFECIIGKSEKKDNVNNIFCIQTRPDISKSPILQDGNRRWEFFSNIVYSELYWSVHNTKILNVF